MAFHQYYNIDADHDKIRFRIFSLFSIIK